MADLHGWIRRNRYALIFSLLTLLTYLVLFFSRHLDDNRLTSWRDALDPAAAVRILFILVAALVVAWLVSRTSVFERHPAVSLFFLSYAVSAMFWAEPEVIVDASRYFTEAKHLELYGITYFMREWGRGIAAWTDMPAVPFLYGLIFRFFGETRLYIQIFNSFLFSGTVVLTYLTGRTLWDERLGMTGGLLLLGIPYLYSQVPLMLVDVPSMFFLALSVYTFIRALDRGGAMIGASALAIFVAFYSKYSTWLMLTVLVVIMAVYVSKGGPRRLKYLYRGIAVAAVSAVMIGAVFVYKWDVFMKQMRLLESYQEPGLRRWGESFFSTFFFQIHPAITAAALYSLYTAYRKRDAKYAVVVWLLVLIVVLQIRRSRYIIMAFPMLVLTASYGLMQIGDKRITRFIALSVAAFSIVVALFAYLPFLDRISMVNLKDAGEFLNSAGMRDIEVLTVMPAEPVANPAVTVPVLDLYTKGEIHYRYKNEGFPDREVIRTSPLRFTWEYRNPAYYSGGGSGGEEAVVVISDKAGGGAIEETALLNSRYPHSRVFRKSEDVFRLQTVVTVYYR
jgi:Dolichyl-phosphate-mannose-protein mannosyltransferase